MAISLSKLSVWNKQKRIEIAIIAGMLFFALGIIIGMRFWKSGSKVVVTIDGEIYGEYDLNMNQDIEIVSDLGVNILKIENGQAGMVSASCPDKICMSMSPISQNDIGVIVCLPNKVIVELSEE